MKSAVGGTWAGIGESGFLKDADNGTGKKSL
jgi:hypothetical protein